MDSDMSVVSSDEEPLQASTSTKKAGGSSSKDAPYKIRHSLKPGRTTQYTANSLYDQIEEGDIELNPDYQRDVVWTDNKQIGLIDSIFRNFYIPPIIFDDGTEKRVCIDGKQRLTSIRRFIKGEIPHRDSITGERYWFRVDSSGSKKRLLPEKLKTSFKNKQIVCVEFNDLPSELEREVFQRVQMGIALTAAEKLQALSGPWPDLIREVMKEYCDRENGGIFAILDMELSRARDFMDLCQAIFCIDQLPDHTHPSALQLERWLKKTESPSNVTLQRVRDTFRVFKAIALDKQLRKPLRKPTRVAPVEFIMTSVLIAMYKDKFSMAQLSEAIGKLRQGVRKSHDDVRMNSKVVKTMVSILTKMKLSEFKQVPGVPVASQVNTAGNSAPSDPRQKVAAGAKRKRVESTDSSSADGADSDEYKPKVKTKIPKNNNPPKEQQTPMRTSSMTMPTPLDVSDLRAALPPGNSPTHAQSSSLQPMPQFQPPPQPPPPPQQPSAATVLSIVEAAKQRAAKIRRELETMGSSPTASTGPKANSVVRANVQPSSVPVNPPVKAIENPLESALMANKINGTHSTQIVTSMPYPTPPPLSQDAMNSSAAAFTSAPQGATISTPVNEIHNGNRNAVVSSARWEGNSPISPHEGHDGGRYHRSSAREPGYSNLGDDYRRDERDRDPRRYAERGRRNSRDKSWDSRDKPWDSRDKPWDPRDKPRDTRDRDRRIGRDYSRPYDRR